MPRQFRLMPCIAIFACSLAATCHAAAKPPTSDEATIAAIIKSGKFMLPKRGQVARIMTSGRYYGMRVDLKYRVNNRDTMITKFAGDTPDKMQTLVNPFSGSGKLMDVRVWLWKDPDPKVVEAAKSKAKRVIEQIYNDIAALSKSYPELALFDKEHVKVLDQSLYFRLDQPDRPQGHQKIVVRCISVEIHEPQLGVGTQAAFPTSIVFPLQKLELMWTVGTEDEALRKIIRSIIATGGQRLSDAEQLLGGSSIGIKSIGINL